MNQELTHEELIWASAEDIEFFNKCIEGLPTMSGKNGDGLDKFGIPIPYSSGPHILRHFRTAIDIANPKGIIEIGLNCGFGSAMLLALFDGYVFSVDISKREETFEAGKFLQLKYPHRFAFTCDGIKDYVKGFLSQNKWDLIFIDGDHKEESIIIDIQLAKGLKIPYLLFDDWYPRYGETQLAVAKFPELELVKDMNNLRLYKWANL